MMPMPPGGGPPSSPKDQASPSSAGVPKPTPSRRRHWFMLGGVLGVVVALAVGLMVWKSTSTRDDPGAGGTGSTAGGAVDRTVGLLREKDPVCDEWGKYADELAEKEKLWAEANKGIPAAKWTTEQREIYDSVGEAMLTAADQFQSILPKARNVVVQELIAQTIVYFRAYVDRIPKYVGSDSLLAGVANNFGGAVTYMCRATRVVPAFGSEEAQMPSAVPEPAALTPFMTGRDPRCKEFQALVERQSAHLRGWVASDSRKAAVQWTPNERALNSAAREVLDRDHRKLRELGERSGNPIMSDLILAQADYMRAFAAVIPDYAPNDAQLWTTVTYLGGGLSAACKAPL